MPKEQLPRTKNLAAKVLFAALQILKEAGGQAPRQELSEEIPARAELDEWARERHETKRYPRWEATLSFFVIDYIKAGFVLRNKGVWYLTAPPAC